MKIKLLINVTHTVVLWWCREIASQPEVAACFDEYDDNGARAACGNDLEKLGNILRFLACWGPR